MRDKQIYQLEGIARPLSSVQNNYTEKLKCVYTTASVRGHIQLHKANLEVQKEATEIT